jgi:hypothetical protein
MTTRTDKRLTWNRAVCAEPKLGDLLEQVRSTERDIWATREGGKIRLSVYGSVRVYHDMIKPRVTHLVGWHRRGGPAFLKTSEAYDIVIKKLWDALPCDFKEYEIHEARERAYEAELDEGEWIALVGPEAEG